MLRSWGIHVDIGEAFLAAVIAHGDILFSDWQADGVVLELSLNSYVGRAATDAWRKVLNGDLPKPVASRMPLAPSSPARVYFG